MRFADCIQAAPALGGRWSPPVWQHRFSDGGFPRPCRGWRRFGEMVHPRRRRWAPCRGLFSFGLSAPQAAQRQAGRAVLLFSGRKASSEAVLRDDARDKGVLAVFTPAGFGAAAAHLEPAKGLAAPRSYR